MYRYVHKSNIGTELSDKIFCNTKAAIKYLESILE